MSSTHQGSSIQNSGQTTCRRQILICGMGSVHQRSPGKDLDNHLEKVQKRAAHFVCGDFTSHSEGCISNMIKSFDWESLANRCKIHRLTVFQQAHQGHLFLPVKSLLQPVQHHSQHLHTNAYNIISTNKDCMKYSFFPRTIRAYTILIKTLYVSFRDRDLINTLNTMSYGIRKFWCWTFTQHTSFYLTSYVTDMNYITHWQFFVHLYQPIHWYLTRILMFLSEQRAPFSTMFASRAFYNVIWSQHSNVQVSIFVTCLNFVGTGSWLWQLYVQCSFCYDMILGV